MKDPVVLVVRWILLAIAVWVAAEVVGGIRYSGWQSILVVAAILGLLNMYVRPVLRILAFPLTIFTLGIFLIVINAVLLGLAAWVSDIFGANFSIDGFWSAFLGALIISLVGMLLSRFIDADRFARDNYGRSRY